MTNDYQSVVNKDTSPPDTICGCIGPQNGQPLCPCQMRGVQIIDGRYVRVQDLGPAPTTNAKAQPQFAKYAAFDEAGRLADEEMAGFRKFSGNEGWDG